MNLGPLIVQSVSSSTSLCTRPIHQIIAWLYPHFLLYMTRKFLVGEGGVFLRKVGHLHQPFCLFRCAWFLLSHTSVSFFLHVVAASCSRNLYTVLPWLWPAARLMAGFSNLLTWPVCALLCCPVPILYGLHLGFYKPLSVIGQYRRAVHLSLTVYH